MTQKGRCTAKEPGAFLAIVHPQPRYNVVPSSMKMRTTPRPRNASGLTWRLILSASSGRRTYYHRHYRTINDKGGCLRLLRFQSSYRPRELVICLGSKEVRVRSSSSLHHHLSLSLAKSVREIRLVVLVDEVVKPWLPAKLVHTLSDFVACCVA